VNGDTRGAIDFEDALDHYSDTAPDTLLSHVDGIEQCFRKAMAHPYDRYSINSADGAGFDITEADYLRVQVIRACMAFRQADAETRDRALKHLKKKLRDADPLRIAGAGVVRGRAKGSETVKQQAAEEDKRITRAAKDILKSAGPMPNAQLADFIMERLGLEEGREAIRKKLPRLLRG
jgi:hypothetical protein